MFPMNLLAFDKVHTPASPTLPTTFPSTDFLPTCSTASAPVFPISLVILAAIGEATFPAAHVTASTSPSPNSSVAYSAVLDSSPFTKALPKLSPSVCPP